ncbi:MAG: hypothetical protein JRD03_08805 [Deltaproteobacteria bacterium]|nr:hypothetical protein [Deltaproteobacteria bacterium]
MRVRSGGHSNRLADGAYRKWLGRRGSELGYVIAAYGIVIGSLAAYGLWVQSQRRILMTRGQQDENDSGST